MQKFVSKHSTTSEISACDYMHYVICGFFLFYCNLPKERNYLEMIAFSKQNLASSTKAAEKNLKMQGGCI